MLACPAELRTSAERAAASQGMADERVLAMVDGQRLEPDRAQHLQANKYSTGDFEKTSFGKL